MFGFFSILADEGTDASNIEHEFVSRLFLVNEVFVGFVPCVKTTGKNLQRLIMKHLAFLGLDLTFLRGHDGAGNISGPMKGLAARIRAQFPLAVYFHCASHILNLCIATGKECQLVRNMLDTLAAVYFLFHETYGLFLCCIRIQVRFERLMQDSLGRASSRAQMISGATATSGGDIAGYRGE